MRLKGWKIYKFLGEEKDVLCRKVRYRFSKLPGLSISNLKYQEGTVTLASIMLRKIRTITGFMLIASGTVAILLPFIPGTALLMAGVALAGSSHPLIKSWIKGVKQWQISIRKTSKPQSGPVFPTITLFKADEGVSSYILLINMFL